MVKERLQLDAGAMLDVLGESVFSHGLIPDHQGTRCPS
jgi:hypothetical protein